MMSEKKDTLHIEADLEQIENTFSTINERISPPYSLTPSVMEGKLEGQAQRQNTVFKTPFIRRTVRCVLSGALSLAIIFLSMGAYWLSASKKQMEADIAVRNQAIAVSNDYSKVYDMLKAYKDKHKSSTKNELGESEYFYDLTADSIRPATGAKAYTTTSTAAETSYGKTNTQVADVDEGDILKNDGNYLYFLSAKKSSYTLKIIKADKAGKMNLISTTAITEKGFVPQELYIYKSEVILVGNYHKQKEATPSITRDVSKAEIDSGSSGSSAGSSNAAPYVAPDYSTYDVAYAMPSSAMVLIYDVKNLAKPVQLNSFKQDGSLISSRLVEKQLYLITNQYTTGDLDKLTAKNTKEYVPSTCIDGGKNVHVSASNIIIVKDSGYINYAVVSGIDVTDVKKGVSTSAILGSGDTVYSTTENLYVTCQRYKEAYVADTKVQVASNSETSILRFSLKDGKIKFTASGTVSGNTLNKYSMDESNGFFRIATTSQIHNKTFTTSNNIYVLDKDLKVCGKVENLAAGETIKSVRFLDKMVYVVTFRQTDPLFAIDLSVPTKPNVLGELKIPGFSSYLHPIGEDYILGVGTDGDSTGFTTGVKLSLFDVSNPKTPTEAFKYVLPGEVSTTLVTSNPKAFLYDADKKVLAIPMNYYGYDVSYTYQSINALSVFKVDTSKGFIPLFDLTNNVPVKDTPDTYYAQEFAKVLRGTYIGDAIFSVSERSIISASISEKKRLDVLDLKDKVEEIIYGSNSIFKGTSVIADDPSVLEITEPSVKDTDIEPYSPSMGIID